MPDTDVIKELVKSRKTAVHGVLLSHVGNWFRTRKHVNSSGWVQAVKPTLVGGFLVEAWLRTPWGKQLSPINVKRAFSAAHPEVELQTGLECSTDFESILALLNLSDLDRRNWEIRRKEIAPYLSIVL